MNISSLMNAIGLGSPNDNDPSLGQGRQLKDFNRTYTSKSVHILTDYSKQVFRCKQCYGSNG